jgi:hypothetical protein
MSELDPAPDAPTNDPPQPDPLLGDAPGAVERKGTAPDPATGVGRLRTAADAQTEMLKASDPEPVKGDWPDDWRERLAKGNEDRQKFLNRYASVEGLFRKIEEQEKFIRSGKVQRDMPDPADEKAVAEWRKEQGIPDDPTGYVLPETITKRLVDADKPMLANFTEFAHKNNLPPSFVEKGAEWYTTLSEQVAEKQAADDTAASEACEDALRKDWAHGEFKANLTLGKRFMESIPGIGASWTEARLPDGRRLGDIAEFVAWSADMGRERFGDSVFASPDAESRHSNRLQEIEALMKTNYQEYLHKGLQDEHMQLLERESKRRK